MHHLPDIPQDAFEQRLFELATDALVVCHVDGTIRRANPAAALLLLGDAEGSVTGAPVGRRPPRRRRPRPRRSSRRSAPTAACATRSCACASSVPAARSAGPRSAPSWTTTPACATSSPATSPAATPPTPSGSARRSATRRPAWRSSAPTAASAASTTRSAGSLGRTEEELLATGRPGARREPRDRRALGRPTTFADGAPGSFELEARLRTGDGRPVVALVSGTLVRDPAGEPLHYLVQFLDVTARIAAQDALAANEAKLAEAQQVARLGSWEWLIDADRVTWSDELYRIHGLRPEATAQSWARHLERVHPDDRARVARAIEAARRRGRAPGASTTASCAPTATCASCTRAARSPSTSPARAVAVHGTCQDVTEARRIEDALRATEQLFRRAFDDSPIGMALIDLEGRWLRLNRALAQMAGRTESDLRATTLAALSHPEDVDLDRPLIRELLAGRRRSYAIEKRMMHADGRVLHLLAHVSLMHGDGERPLYFLVQLIDLSERRRAEAEQRAGEQRLQAIIDNAPALISVKDARQRFLLVNRRYEEADRRPGRRGPRPHRRRGAAARAASTAPTTSSSARSSAPARRARPR